MGTRRGALPDWSSSDGKSGSGLSRDPAALLSGDGSSSLVRCQGPPLHCGDCCSSGRDFDRQNRFGMSGFIGADVGREP